MRLGEKLVNLRYVEGLHRNLGRAMTKAEVVRSMQQELGESVSHAYLCQLENGSRIHMTAGTRERLARFFKVLPGYLVDDPPGYESALRVDLHSRQERLETRLATAAEELREEPYLAHVLLKLSRTADPMRWITLLDRMLEMEPNAVNALEKAIGRSSADHSRSPGVGGS